MDLADSDSHFEHHNFYKKPVDVKITLKDSITMVAKSVQTAFPSLKHLTFSDLTIGIAYVACDHIRSKFEDYEYELSCLQPILSKKYKTTAHHLSSVKYYNPENISNEFLEKYESILKYAHLAYHAKYFHKNDASYWTKNRKLELDHYAFQYNLHEHRLQYIISNDIPKHLQSAYYMAADHEKKRIIISIAGTANFADLFTDLTAEPAPVSFSKFYGDEFDQELERMKDQKHFSVTELDSNEKVSGFIHKGVLQSAEWVYHQLKEKLAEQILIYPEYEILCTGHSIGGAISCALTLILRENFKFGTIWSHISKSFEQLNQSLFITKVTICPQIFCVAFSPAACLSYNMGQWASTFVTSFVNGADLIPRFSAGSGEKLRLEILNSNWEARFESLKNLLYKDYIHGYATSVLPTVNGFFDKLKIRKPSFLVNWQAKTNEIENSKPNPSEEMAEAEMINSSTVLENENSQQLHKSQSTPLLPSINSLQGISSETVKKEQQLLERTKLNKDIIMMYPPGDVYYFIEERKNVEFLNKDKKLEFMPCTWREKEHSTTTKSSSAAGNTNWTDLILTTVLNRLMESTKTIQQQLQQQTSVERPTKRVRRSITNQRRFILRHVDASHFDRIIFSVNMLDDHRFVHFYDAFEFAKKANIKLESHNSLDENQYV